MINIWLKIRDRGNLNFVLKHLNFWLGIFSNSEEYKIFIYNENVNLPKEYNCFNILNRNSIIKNKQCIELHKLINNSIISDYWKKTAFALSCPYFFLDSEYVWNIDADDMILYGADESFFKKTLNELIKHDLSTLSYDYMYSKHLFSLRNIFPNLWTFGLNISNIEKMKKIIYDCINVYGKDFVLKYKNKINEKNEICLDFLIHFFINELSDNKYNCFLGNYNFSHSNFYTSYFDINIHKLYINSSQPGNNTYLPMNGYIDVSKKTVIL